MHKVAAQCITLGFGEVTPNARKRYKHNVDNAHDPYVIVSAYEGQCTVGNYPPLPGTPVLARKEGILDAISFASSYQTSFRIEVPLWHKVEDGITQNKSFKEQLCPRAAGKSHSRLRFARSTRAISAEGCARTGQIALSPAFRALDTHDLRRGLCAQPANRTLACISRTRHARSPQRVALSVDAVRPALRL